MRDTVGIDDNGLLDRDSLCKIYTTNGSDIFSKWELKWYCQRTQKKRTVIKSWRDNHFETAIITVASIFRFLLWFGQYSCIYEPWWTFTTLNKKNRALKNNPVISWICARIEIDRQHCFCRGADFITTYIMLKMIINSEFCLNRTKYKHIFVTEMSNWIKYSINIAQNVLYVARIEVILQRNKQSLMEVEEKITKWKADNVHFKLWHGMA